MVKGGPERSLRALSPVVLLMETPNVGYIQIKVMHGDFDIIKIQCIARLN